MSTLNCLSLIYSENIKITFDFSKKEFDWYFMDSPSPFKYKFKIHKKLFSSKRTLCLIGYDKTLSWNCEKSDNVFPCIIFDNKLFCLANNTDENQIKLFNRFMKKIFG
jgi:hypothetical protein